MKDDDEPNSDYKKNILQSFDKEFEKKMSTEYNMLSYVGSEMDEVHMDNLQFLKMQPLILKKEFDLELISLFETDLSTQILLQMVENKAENTETFIGLSNSKSQPHLMKVCAYFY